MTFFLEPVGAVDPDGKPDFSQGVDPARNPVVDLDVVARELSTLSAPIASSAPVLSEYLQRLGTPASRRTMLATLGSLARIASGGAMTADRLPWWALRPEHTAAIRGALLDGSYALTSAARFVSGLRSILKICVSRRLMRPEVFDACLATLGGVGTCRPPGPPIDPAIGGRLLSACRDNTVIGLRDGAIILLLWCCLRAVDVRRLDALDWDAASASLRLHRLRAAGDMLQPVRFPGEVAAWLTAWMNIRQPTIGAMFVPATRTRILGIRRLSASTITEVVRGRFLRAGLSPMSLRDFRRGVLALQAPHVGLLGLRRITGHARARTTLAYMPLTRPTAR
ncbi:MAG: site-specific integrase [Deltaproteobacteria bacterium]|nr:site-specific integrase [Deltaproteobacteria bacterium]